jgi:hypothetical protein
MYVGTIIADPYGKRFVFDVAEGPGYTFGVEMIIGAGNFRPMFLLRGIACE